MRTNDGQEFFNHPNHWAEGNMENKRLVIRTSTSTAATWQTSKQSAELSDTQHVEEEEEEGGEDKDEDLDKDKEEEWKENGGWKLMS